MSILEFIDHHVFIGTGLALAAMFFVTVTITESAGAIGKAIGKRREP